MSRPTAAYFAPALLLAFAASVQVETVEIHLADTLDNIQTGYCLDIARAQGDRADPADGLQGHTCYSPSGALGVDRTFEADKFA